jgi:hypothetical protein
LPAQAEPALKKSVKKGKKFTPVPGIIDPVFVKTSQNARFLLSENERFGLVFVKTGAQNYRPCFRENQPKRSFSIK